DLNCEGNETFSVILDSATGAPLGSQTTSTATIVTDDARAIEASAGANGTISPSGTVGVSCGASQTFTITPNPCYQIADVTVDGVSRGAIASYSFTNVAANHTIAASFSLIGYAIAASAGSNGAISPSGAVAVGCGASQTFTIAPNPCYQVADVVVDGVSRGAVSSYAFTSVAANHTIVASFVLGNYSIAASAGANGTIAPSGAVSVACNGSQSFTITPNACYVIADVVVDGVSRGAVASYAFTTVLANHTIAATFSLTGYSILTSPGANGSIAPGGVVAVSCGASQTFTITPDPCFQRSNVLVDGLARGAVSSYTFSNVSANHTIAASFSLVTYSITASAGANGTISPSGAVPAGCGSSKTFTITPNSCYQVASVVVDGVSRGALASYTFASVAAHHTIVASFVPSAAATTPVTDLAATQVRSGNDASGTTEIAITYTLPPGASSVEVWRKGFGNYPRYDDPPSAGSTP
ncbi:MAG TPA: hypothetical protein VLV15_00195, partial [Dongiaceae bacterium]|nr:hypothetical protein [Dongiaceae bacterium]